MLKLSPKLLYLIKYIKSRESNSINKQLQLIDEIAQENSSSLEGLLYILQISYKSNTLKPNCIYGYIYQTLYKSEYIYVANILKRQFPLGIVKFNSSYDINYDKLHLLLIEQKFQEADKLTQNKLCKLANIPNQNRTWLYFTDIKKLPGQDLQHIDQLWNIYSKGKFGFSIQKKIWLQSNKDWNQLWINLGWQINNKLCRYPSEFIWEINAPNGHLPLFNQLRGVRSLEYLFDHPAWLS
uniref:Conserved hypothetical plastid protein n=1 Tax=Bulboplastis apyrenoidosa TaxID=1070855 RepID=A0A1Y9TM37_9RHOD|nr:conserved hypothetical plastid protein [Bulboplastis apyrenoidosa]ARO90695.1 conserved hypothetical plastid protein [Bulboplastis apyrenoidosa]